MDDLDRRVSFSGLGVVLETGADLGALVKETHLGMIFSGEELGVMSTENAGLFSLSTRVSSLSPGLTLTLISAGVFGSTLILFPKFRSLLLSVKSPCVGIVIVIGIHLENLDSIGSLGEDGGAGGAECGRHIFLSLAITSLSGPPDLP